MALEVKVFREITDYQAKVIFGLSWRQAGTLLVAIPVLGGVYAGFFLAGLQDLGVVVVSVVMVPAAAFGWVRPMGIPFEKYVGYFWAFRQGRKFFTFSKVDLKDLDGEKRNEDEIKEAKALPRRGRRARKKFAAFESTN